MRVTTPDRDALKSRVTMAETQKRKEVDLQAAATSTIQGQVKSLREKCYREMQMRGHLESEIARLKAELTVARASGIQRRT